MQQHQTHNSNEKSILLEREKRIELFYVNDVKSKRRKVKLSGGMVKNVIKIVSPSQHTIFCVSRFCLFVCTYNLRVQQ